MVKVRESRLADTPCRVTRRFFSPIQTESNEVSNAMTPERREMLALLLDPAPQPDPPPRWRVWRLRTGSGHITTAALPAPATADEVMATFTDCRRCWPAAFAQGAPHDNEATR